MNTMMRSLRWCVLATVLGLAVPSCSGPDQKKSPSSWRVEKNKRAKHKPRSGHQPDKSKKTTPAEVHEEHEHEHRHPHGESDHHHHAHPHPHLPGKNGAHHP